MSMRFIFSNRIVLQIQPWVLVKRDLFFVGLKYTSQVAAHQINLESSVFKQGALAIRRIFSLVDMITKPKFSNYPAVFKIGLFR